MTNALQAKHVAYETGSAMLVGRLNLDVAAGEFVAVVGPNGAGKSTLIRLLAGDLRPTAGEVLFGGHSVAEMRPHELALSRAVLLQETDPTVPFSVGAVVALGRYPHRKDSANSRANDRDVIQAALQRTETAHLTERIFATLSAGERTRVALARVFAQETGLLLLDEPTATLDVGHQEQILAHLRVEAAAGAGIIVVLHDLNAAASCADRIVILRDGVAVSDGSPASVLTGELLSDVYQQEMRVVDHPFRDCPLVLVVG